MGKPRNADVPADIMCSASVMIEDLREVWFVVTAENDDSYTFYKVFRVHGSRQGFSCTRCANALTITYRVSAQTPDMVICHEIYLRYFLGVKERNRARGTGSDRQPLQAGWRCASSSISQFRTHWQESTPKKVTLFLKTVGFIVFLFFLQ